jgi:hypothetical protein
MQKTNRLLILFVVLISFSSCSIIEGIFKAGIEVFGIFIVICGISHYNLV